MNARRLFRILLRTLAVACILAVLLLAALHTAWARERVAAELSRRLTAALGQPVELAGLDWQWSRRITCRQLRIGTASNEVTVAGLRVEWAPGSVHRHGAVLSLVSADRLTLPPRLPALAVPSTEPGSTPFALDLKAGQIGEIFLPAEWGAEAEPLRAVVRLRTGFPGEPTSGALSLSNACARLTARVSGAPDALTLDARLAADAGCWLNRMAGLPSLPGWTAMVRASGNATNAAGQVELDAAGQGKLAAAWSMRRSASGLSLEATPVVRLARPLVPGALDRFLGADLTGRLRAELPEGGPIRLDLSSVVAGDFTAEGHAEIDPGSRDWSGAFTAGIPTPFPTAWPVRAEFLRVTASLRGAGTEHPGSVRVDLDAALQAARAEIADLDALLGPAPNLHASGWIGPDGWTAGPARLHLAAGEGTLTSARGAWDGNLETDWTLTLPSLAAMPSLAQARVAGRADLSGSLRRDDGTPSGSLTLQSTRLVLADEILEPLTAITSWLAEPEAWSGDARIRSDWRGQALASSFAWHAGSNRVAVTGLALQCGRNDLHAELVWDGDWSGALSADLCELGLLQDFIGRPTQGTARLSVHREPGAGARPWTGIVVGEGIAVSPAEVERFALGWQWDGSLHVAGRAEGVTVGAERVGDVLLHGGLASDGRAGGAGFHLNGPGDRAVEGSVRWHGRIGELDADWGEVRVRANGEQVRLWPGALTRWRDGQMDLRQARLDWRGARLFLEGTGSEREWSGLLLAEDLALDQFTSDAGPWVRGIARGRVELGGTPAAPVLRAQVSADGLHPAHADLAELPASTAWLDAEWSAPGLRARGAWLLDGGGGFQGEASLDHAPGLSVPLPTTAFSGRLDGALDVDLLNRLPWAATQAWQGHLAATLGWSGTWARPDVTGALLLENGRFEHGDLGLDLRDIQAALAWREGGVHLDRFTARDGGPGRITGQGRLLLDHAAGPSGALELDVRDLTLVRNPVVRAPATGNLRLELRPAGLFVGGRLALDPVRVLIPGQTPTGEGDFRVVDAARPAPAPLAPTAPAPPVSAASANLDVRLDVPGRMTVRGRGLDSEWEGRLDLRGTAAAPQLTGSLTPRRGQFDFFGQPFRFAESRVTFTGAFPPDPLLNLRLERTRGDLDAAITITGPARRPVVELASEPALPQDELLPRVLFGRNLDELSAWQGVRMAQAANALRGGGNSFDIMGRARRLLAADQFNVEQARAEGSVARVTAGKYLADRVYLEGEGEVGRAEGRLTLEVELNRRLSLETDVRQDLKQGVGLKLRHDF